MVDAFLDLSPQDHGKLVRDELFSTWAQWQVAIGLDWCFQLVVCSVVHCHLSCSDWTKLSEESLYDEDNVKLSLDNGV